MRIRIGPLWIDALGFDQALDRIEQLAASGEGGAVFTPNVDHVVNAARRADFREAYAGARLSLADGQPLVWASRLLGTRLPEKVSGSDLVPRLLDRAAKRGLRVYFLGGVSGVAAEAARVARERFGLEIVGVDSPAIGAAGEADPAVLARVREARAQIVLVALGSPKQELFIHRHQSDMGGAAALGIGASLDFLAGRVRRCPAWMSRVGLEWLYRLAQDPRRLA